MSASDELRAHLIVIYEHSRDALKLLDADAPADLTLPKGSSACRHTHKTPSMGGYWTCHDCGAKGRDV